MILESKYNARHVSDIQCVYWKIPGLNNKRHSERNPEGRTGVSGYEYLERERERENYTHHVLVIKTKRQNFVLHEYIYRWVSIT